MHQPIIIILKVYLKICIWCNISTNSEKKAKLYVICWKFPKVVMQEFSWQVLVSVVQHWPYDFELLHRIQHNGVFSKKDNELFSAELEFLQAWNWNKWWNDEKREWIKDWYASLVLWNSVSEVFEWPVYNDTA